MDEMGSPISETWVYATMLIKNEWDKLGTGFLVFRLINEKKGKLFLVTNKHVLNEKQELRERASEITIFLNIKKEDGVTVGKKAKLPLSFDTIKRDGKNIQKGM